MFELLIHLSNIRYGFAGRIKSPTSQRTLFISCFSIQNIVPQPLSYFHGLVSPIAVEDARKKQAGKNRTWFILTVEGVGVHFFTFIRKYGNTDPYSVFYHRSIRILWFIRVN